VPGRIWPLNNDAHSRSMELRFDTVEFLGWSVVVFQMYRKR
jgi:hypothetical protein